MMPGVPVPDEREKAWEHFMGLTHPDVSALLEHGATVKRAHGFGFDAGWEAATARSEAQVRALTLALTDLLEWAEHGEGFAPSGLRRTPAIAKARAALPVPNEGLPVSDDYCQNPHERFTDRHGVERCGLCDLRVGPVPVEGEADRRGERKNDDG